MASRLARPLLVTGIAVAPARQALKGSGSSGGRAPAPAALRQRTWTPSKPGDQEDSQQRTEHCTNVVPGRECCGGATAPALARTTISAPLLMTPDASQYRDHARRAVRGVVGGLLRWTISGCAAKRRTTTAALSHRGMGSSTGRLEGRSSQAAPEAARLCPMSRASVAAALTRVSLRPAAVQQAAGYWSCLDCSASLDSGSLSGKPATVSVSCSPGFEALSAASSGWSCVDSLTAISLVAVAGGLPRRRGSHASASAQNQQRRRAVRPLSQWTTNRDSAARSRPAPEWIGGAPGAHRPLGA